MKQNDSMERLLNLRGKPVMDSSGEKIGKVEDIFFDKSTRVPEWIGLGSGGVFGSKRLVVPCETAKIEADGIRVPYSKDQVNNTPSISGTEISEEQEAELYRSYGLQYSESWSDTGLPGGKTNQRTQAPPQHATGGDEASITLNEEQLRVGKREVDAGTVRLKKYVETTPVTEDIELRRETAQIERTPINEPATSAEFGEQEVEVNLREEKPVVEKQAVAREKVTLRKQDETTKQQVNEQVRKERVDEEGGKRTRQ